MGNALRLALAALGLSLTLASAARPAPTPHNSSAYSFVADEGQRCSLVGDKFAICNTGLCCGREVSTHLQPLSFGEVADG